MRSISELKISGRNLVAECFPVDKYHKLYETMLTVY